MENRAFGATTLTTSVLGLGCASLGSRVGRRVAAATVAEAVDSGITFFDTAPFYGQGQSESILGSSLLAHRSKVFVATKIGLYPSAALRALAHVKPIVRSALKALPGLGRKSLQKSVQGFLRSQNEVRFDRHSIERSVEHSLRRLRSSAIDLLLLHVTPAREHIDDVIDVLLTLQHRGAIRHFGASSHSYEDTMMWLSKRNSGISALQVMLNLYELTTLDDCIPLAKARGIALVAREPFAQGRLLPPGKLDAQGIAFMGQTYDQRFEHFANSHSQTVPDVAIAFLAQTPGISVVLAGMSTPEHVRRNVAALDLPRFSEREMLELRSIATAN